MRKNRFNEGQVVGIQKEHQVGWGGGGVPQPTAALVDLGVRSFFPPTP